MTDHRPEVRELIRQALNELGVPNKDYPAPVANAVEILQRALSAPPIEPVGMREACIEFGKLIQREAQMRHGWENYTGQQVIELVVKWWFEKQPWGVAAALAACDKPVVVEVAVYSEANMGLSALVLEHKIANLKTGDRVRVVVYKVK